MLLSKCRAATAGKAGKVWPLPRFWVTIGSYQKQLVKKFLGRTLDLAWLKFAVAALLCVTSSETRSVCAKQASAKFENSSLIGQCRSLRWLRDMFFYKITTLLRLFGNYTTTFKDGIFEFFFWTA